MNETIITPDSGIAAARHALRSMATHWPMTKDLAWRLFLRDIKAMYRLSILGYIWILLPPLANTAVWVYLNQQNVININTGDVPYPVFVLSGTLLWAAFNGIVIGMLSAVQESRGMVSKINFPHEALLLSSFAKAAVNAIAPLLLLAPLLLVFGVSIGPNLALFPIALISLMLMGATFSVLLLPIATLFNDVGRGMQLLLRFWFFLTPIIYPIPKHGTARLVAEWNPVTPLLLTARSWLIGEGPQMITELAVLTGFCALLLVIGVIIFKLAMPYLIERMSA